MTYDMGWQKRSSGRIYDFSSGHAFIIGAISMGIIGIGLYYKACRKCGAAEKRGEELEEHERLVRYLAIEQALWEEIKHTLEHKNHS